ncbi:NifB/NifX family molybdenum-iron cluster-binding protein [bacterium]|nr:NifB/NifX family molybdenum-iron cluster-binding protein [bacterium]
MKYLVAASAADLDAKISKRFGHANYFLIVDPETFEFEVKTSVGENDPSRGIGRYFNQDIKTVIVGNIGPGIFTSMSNTGWQIYSCIGLTVREAVEKVRDGLVSALTASTMKHSIRNGGGGAGGGRGQGRGNGHPRNKR